MAQQIKIPLWVAILININIIMGAAFFLGAPTIATLGPILAPFSWLTCGLFLLPLVFVFAKLAHLYPSAGGLYIYSAHRLGRFWGFMSGWCYYVGGTAINALVLHSFCSGLQSIPQFTPLLKTLHLDGLLLDVSMVICFSLLNLLNVKFIERFQVGLVVLKLIPFILVLVAVPFLCTGCNFGISISNFHGLTTNIPLVFFAYIGLEACCSIADKIEHGRKNAAKAIYISFALTTILYTILQLAFILVNGSTGSGSFFTIIPQLTSNQTIITLGNYLIQCAILSSYIGGFYGMFYFNNWNLFAMAQEKSILFGQTLTKVNKNGMPSGCILVQAIIILVFLLFTHQANSLAVMGDFGTMVAYLLSVISFLTLYKTITGWLALLSSFVFMYLFTQNLLGYGLHYLLPFLCIITIGIVAYNINKRQS